MPHSKMSWKKLKRRTISLAETGLAPSQATAWFRICTLSLPGRLENYSDMNMAKIVAGLVLMLCAATLMSGQPRVSSLVTEIPIFSEKLAKERGPTEAPFIVTYRFGTKVLAFVGTDHVFTDENSTIDAVRRTFVDTKPSLVIIEGFPTALGQNFEPIVEAARRRDRPDADAFAKSEAVFTASQALASMVPFIGGEPTLREEIEGLVVKGYNRDDVLFAIRLRPLGQARRSGEMPAGNAAAFTARYERESRAVANMAGTEPATEAKFIADYTRIVGVDPISDPEMPSRSDPGTDTLLQRMSADNMRFRDEHLLSTILQQLERNDRVLVVYGSSHWTTLSRALQGQLGKPVIVTKEAIKKLGQ
jgi:hypothetical protein